MESDAFASSSARVWKYDVYLSFRGPDSRKGITFELYDRLQNRGIKTFKDDRDLEVGNAISPTLLKAIEESRFAIVVLSPNYASSAWCLEELAKICECMEDDNRILPLFYYVDPGDVRHQQHSFGDAFTKHGRSGRHRSEKVQQWRNALKKVASFSGWDSKTYRTERQLVEDIVEYVYSKVQAPVLVTTPLDNALSKLGLEVKDDILPDVETVTELTQHQRIKAIPGDDNIKGLEVEGGILHDIEMVRELTQLQRTMAIPGDENMRVSIGIDDRIKEVIRLLKTDDKDVKHTAVILQGLAGIGKTTLATEVINALKQLDFGFSYASVSLDSQRNDFETQAIELQSRIISQLARKRAVVDCIGTGQTKLRKVLSSGHCFIFVDNVVEGRQLHGVFPQDLPNNQRLRILVTSRDLDVSKEIPVDNRYRKVYAVDSLPYSPSLLLLKKSVGIKDDGDEKFVGELQKIEEVAKLCHGVPLLLILVGKDLKFCRVKDYYDSTLKTLTSAAADFSRWESRKIFDHLLRIFKLLDESVQIAFLDICVFFIGKKWGRVCDIVGKRAMDALNERCFIKRDVDNCVCVHDIMRDIAMMLAERVNNRFIINFTDNGIDTSFMDLSLILGEDVKDTQIEGLFIYGTDCQTINLRPGNLPSLRLFEASGITVEFKDDKSCTTFRELQYFSLSQPKHKGVVEFLFKHADPSLPIEVLSLHGMEDLHELPRGLWRMDKLTVLEITSCHNLESLPADLIHLRCLKQLKLQNSEMLNTLPDTLGNLKWLEELILTGCSSLQALPDSTCQLYHLKKLDMAGCESIASLPDAVGQLGSLEIIDLSSCLNLKRLPTDLSGLVSLKELNLTRCYSLKALPDSICSLKCLKKLEMAGCESISSLPAGMGQLKLEELILTGCSSLQTLPDSICQLCWLKKLDMSGCESISSLPNAMGGLELEELILTGCSSLRELPDSICLLQWLKKLDMAGCASISSLPDAFRQLRSLEIIDLSSCSNLKGLPSDLSGLVSLKELTLTRCYSLKALPDSICFLKCLKKLDMAGCAIVSSLPDAFGQLRYLEVIDLSSCSNLKGLPSDLSGLISLKELNLKNCRKFKAFPAQLRDITSLEKLIFTKSKKATYGGFWKHIVPS